MCCQLRLTGPALARGAPGPGWFFGRGELDSLHRVLTNTSDSHFVSTTPRAMGLYLNVEAPEFLDELERLEAKNEGLAPFQYEAVD